MGMRATLVCNTIHIPEILAAKRIHPQQTTNYEAYKTSAQKAKFIEMVKAALPILEKHNPKFSKQLRLENLLFVYERQRLRAAIQEASDKRQKLLLILNYLINNPRFFIEFLYQRFLQSRSQDDFTYIRKELKRLGLDRGVEVIDNQP